MSTEACHDEDEEPLIASEDRPFAPRRSESSRGHDSPASCWTKVVLAGFASLAVLSVVPGAHVNGHPRSWNTDDGAVRLQVSAGSVNEEETDAYRSGACQDTRNWADGFTLCLSNGYKGPGCTTAGLTCEAYRAAGWCSNGKTWVDFATSAERRNPNEHCCACGGGSRSSFTSPASGLSATACSTYQDCAEMAGDCCPNFEGEILQCCNSAPVCLDTPDWTNGDTSCTQDGLGEADGCASGGLTCVGYLEQGHCENGAVVLGHESLFGAGFNNPELHCCACGRNVQKAGEPLVEVPSQ